MKSAVELAMERAEAALGDEKIDLTPEQKEAMDQVRKKYTAKFAEQEIALKARLQSVPQDADPRERAEAQAQIQRELNRVREELFAERDAQLEAIRRGGSHARR